MAIITLTTDFGEKDHFAGAVKGAIYSEHPEVRIVDISHSVSPFNIPEAAYIIQNAYANFPKGTIHIIGIDSELNQENKHIAIKLDEHYFICANNGILSMITSFILPEKMVEIYPDKIINIHPALLPKYGGKGMYGMHVHQAVLENKEEETGITIHYVNENYDEGAFVFQKTVSVIDCITPEQIAEKVHQLEHEFFPVVIASLLTP